MSLCIMCREEKDLTEEHIIPDCIGGSLKSKLLCKDCNSTIGRTIDGPFSNSVFVQLPRQSYQIRGKSGEVPNAFGVYGSTNHEGKGLNIRLDKQFQPYVKPIVTEHTTDHGLEINITIDKEDEGGIESILCKKISRYYRSLGMLEQDIQNKVEQDIEIAKNSAVAISNQPTIKYSFLVDMDSITFECIKIAYEIAALEFGEKYVTKSPIAEVLRCTIRNNKKNRIAGTIGVNLGPIQAYLPGQDGHYILLLHNSCVVSLFGLVSTVEFCGEHESFARSQKEAILYVFDPINQSHKRFLLTDYITKQTSGNV